MRAIFHKPGSCLSGRAAGAAGAEHDGDLAGRGRAGTHDTLSQADGLYAELFRLQARGLRLIMGTGLVVDGARSQRGRCALCADHALRQGRLPVQHAAARSPAGEQAVGFQHREVLADRSRALAELARHLRGADRDGGTFQDRRPGPAQQGGELVVRLMAGRFQAFPHPPHAVRGIGEVEDPWLAVLDNEAG
jgi:hypothetical protein